MALLEVPYVFHRTGIRPGCRNPERAALSAKTIMRVPELMADQAPLVARAAYADRVLARDGAGNLLWVDAEVETDYRVVNGALVRRMVADRSSLWGNGWHHAPDLEAHYRQRRQHHLDRWIEDPLTIGLADAEQAMELLRTSMRDTDLVHAPLMAPPGRMHRDQRAAFGEQDGFARHMGDNSLAAARLAKAALEGRICMVDGALYMPSRGPAWRIVAGTGPNPGYLQALPELGWLGGLEYTDVHLPGDPVLAHRAQAMHAAGQRIGRVEIIDGDWCPHPEEYLARGVADGIAGAGMADVFCTGGYTDGLRGLAGMLDLANNNNPCGAELSQVLADMAIQIERTFAHDTPAGAWAHHARAPAARAALRTALLAQATPAPGRRR